MKEGLPSLAIKRKKKDMKDGFFRQMDHSSKIGSSSKILNIDKSSAGFGR